MLCGRKLADQVQQFIGGLLVGQEERTDDPIVSQVCVCCMCVCVCICVVEGIRMCVLVHMHMCVMLACLCMHTSLDNRKSVLNLK